MAVLDDVIIDYKGVHPLLTALFVLILLFCELVAISIVTAPLTKSIDVECDPQKHLILNASLNKRKDLDYVYAMDLFFMGDFKGALGYANKMVAHKKATTVSVGLFNKARCEFFLGDFESMRVTVQQYEAVVAGLKKEARG